MTTKNKLTWRLTKLPTSQELIELVNSKVISPEEAKDVLFSLDSVEERDKKSLEDEIKFLKNIIDKLSTDRLSVVRTIESMKPRYITNPWFQSYDVWCGGQTTNGATSGSVPLNNLLNF